MARTRQAQIRAGEELRAAAKAAIAARKAYHKALEAYPDLKELHDLTHLAEARKINLTQDFLYG